MNETWLISCYITSKRNKGVSFCDGSWKQSFLLHVTDALYKVMMFNCLKLGILREFVVKCGVLAWEKRVGHVFYVKWKIFVFDRYVFGSNGFGERLALNSGRDPLGRGGKLIQDVVNKQEVTFLFWEVKKSFIAAKLFEILKVYNCKVKLYNCQRHI